MTLSSSSGLKNEKPKMLNGIWGLISLGSLILGFLIGVGVGRGRETSNADLLKASPVREPSRNRVNGDPSETLMMARQRIRSLEDQLERLKNPEEKTNTPTLPAGDQNSRQVAQKVNVNEASFLEEFIPGELGLTQDQERTLRNQWYEWHREDPKGGQTREIWQSRENLLRALLDPGQQARLHQYGVERVASYWDFKARDDGIFCPTPYVGILNYVFEVGDNADQVKTTIGEVPHIPDTMLIRNAYGLDDSSLSHIAAKRLEPLLVSSQERVKMAEFLREYGPK
jgi:hypothetical protein